MKTILKSLLILAISVIGLVSCSEDSDDKPIPSNTAPSRQCIPTRFSATISGMESVYEFSYDTLKRLTKTKSVGDNVTTETFYTYDALNNVIKTEKKQNDTISNYLEISYENNKISAETRYNRSSLTGTYIKSTVDRYVYEGNVLKRVNHYGVSSGNETLFGYTDFEFDANGNVKKSTRYYLSMGNPKIETVLEYSYTNIISTVEINWVLGNGIPYLQNKTLQASVKSSYYDNGVLNEVETMNLMWSNLNAKGYAQSLTVSSSSGNNAIGSITYKCD